MAWREGILSWRKHLFGFALSIALAVTYFSLPLWLSDGEPVVTLRGSFDAEDGLEIVTVAPASPVIGGTIAVDYLAEPSARPSIFLGRRSLKIVKSEPGRLYALLPSEIVPGHGKLRLVRDGQKSRAHHVQLRRYPWEQVVPAAFGALALVLFGTRVLGTGLGEALGRRATTTVAVLFEAPLIAFLVGAALGLLSGSVLLSGAVLAALVLARLAASRAAAIACLGSTIGVSLFGHLHPGTFVAEGGGLWLLWGCVWWGASEMRRWRAWASVLAGFGAICFGASQLLPSDETLLGLLGGSPWDTWQGEGWSRALSESAFALLLPLVRQGTEGHLELALRGPPGVGGLSLFASGALSSTAVVLVMALLGHEVARYAVRSVLLGVSAAVVAIALGLALEAQGRSSPFAAVIGANGLLMALGIVLSMAADALFERFRRRSGAREKRLVASLEAIGTRLRHQKRALTLILLEMRTLEREPAEEAGLLLGKLDAEGDALEREGRPDEDWDSARRRVAWTLLGASQRCLREALAHSERFTDVRIVDLVNDPNAEVISPESEAHLHAVERHLLDGFRDLGRALEGAPVRLELAMQRLLLNRSSPGLPGSELGPAREDFLLVLRALEILGHELYRMSELFGDDPVADALVALAPASLQPIR